MYVRVEILAVENTPLKTTFSGIIRKEYVRSYDIEGLDLFKCFAPNDIVKAKVLEL